MIFTFLLFYFSSVTALNEWMSECKFCYSDESCLSASYQVNHGSDEISWGGFSVRLRIAWVICGFLIIIELEEFEKYFNANFQCELQLLFTFSFSLMIFLLRK